MAMDGKGYNIGEKVQRSLREKLWGPRKSPRDTMSQDARCVERDSHVIYTLALLAPVSCGE